MSQRRLPPVLSARDRHWAAIIQADKLVAQMRESELARAAWTETASGWIHFIDSAGGITSERAGAR